VISIVSVKLNDGHVYTVKFIISWTVQDRDVVTTDHTNRK